MLPNAPPTAFIAFRFEAPGPLGTGIFRAFRSKSHTETAICYCPLAFEVRIKCAASFTHFGAGISWPIVLTLHSIWEGRSRIIHVNAPQTASIPYTRFELSQPPVRLNMADFWKRQRK